MTVDGGTQQLGSDIGPDGELILALTEAAVDDIGIGWVDYIASERQVHEEVDACRALHAIFSWFIPF